MSQLFKKDVHLGILKGGQLARMLLQPCMNFGVIPHVMDKDPHAPAQPFCQNFTVGDGLDFEDVYNFGKDLDALTLEFEHVNLDALRKLEEEGVKVYPGTDLIAIVQDKGLQKEFYQKNGIPTADFTLVNGADEIQPLLAENPVVQKKRVAGYDGRGVAVLDKPDDMGNAFDEPSVIEQKVDIAKEISVLVARNEAGQIEIFPTVEMVFHPEANLLDYLFSPAQIDSQQEQDAERLAGELAEKLNLIGLLAVEMFIDQKGAIYVNEIAPRPHNSGHHTIEANATSQFEQLIRSIFNLSLGSAQMHSPAAMVNIVGEPGHEGPVVFEGLEPFLKIPGVYPHCYGKKNTRPYRKMGHVTIVRDDLNECLELAKQIKKEVRAISCPK